MQLSTDELIGNAIAWIGGVILDVAVFVLAFVAVLVLGKYLLVPAVGRILESRGLGGSIQSLGESVTDAVVWALALAVGFTVAVSAASVALSTMGYGVF